MKIVADAHIPFVEDYIAPYGELTLIPGRAITASDVGDADILLVRSITEVNQALLQQASVRFVGSITAGADHVDAAWLASRGVDFGTVHGFNAPPVADYVVSVVAALQRRQLLAMTGAKVAVVGVGAVGKLVVSRLQLLGYTTILCDPLRAKAERDFSQVTLDDIADVDMICLHVPLTREGDYPTYHFIDEAFLRRQKPGCVLLNASRGAVIDSAELMQHGAHLHWCFDVWENEPSINKAILERAVIATPHIAGYSVQSKHRGIQMMRQLLIAKQLLQEHSVPPEDGDLARQTLSFAGQQHHWQDVVMGVFNPLVMSAMMRAVLLASENGAQAFDVLRQQFNYRHELAYTTVLCDSLLEFDRQMLVGLGVQV